MVIGCSWFETKTFPLLILLMSGKWHSSSRCIEVKVETSLSIFPTTHFEYIKYSLPNWIIFVAIVINRDNWRVGNDFNFHGVRNIHDYLMIVLLSTYGKAIGTHFTIILTFIESFTGILRHESFFLIKSIGIFT